jgi:hypothetical protein
MPQKVKKPAVVAATTDAKKQKEEKPLLLSWLLGPKANLTRTSFLIIVLFIFPLFFFSAYSLLRLITPAPDGTSNGMCSGVCSLPAADYEPPLSPPNVFPETCAPLDPLSIFFLRIPKSATTRFLTITERIRRYKGFRTNEFPDLPDAVAASRDVAEWDARKLSMNPKEKEKFYKGVMAKVGLHATGSKSIGGLPWRKPSESNDPGADRFDSQGRVLRMFFYGHIFLPPWSRGRHFQTPEDQLAKVPSVVGFVKDPVSRMASAYNYVRAGARSPEHREEIIKNRGNLTVGQCVADSNCTDMNALRKSCSLQALYYCGDHDDCVVPWRVITSENYADKLAPLVNRAIKNMEEQVLFTGVAEEMDASMAVLEKILPTYFEGAARESSKLDEEKRNRPKKTRVGEERLDEGAFERNFKANGGELGATNEAAPYAKPTAADRDVVAVNGICYADMRIYEHAKKLLEQRRVKCGFERYDAEL